MYYVYVHTVPNGKIYIGQTKDLLRRWNGGEGYIDNRPFYKDIQVYGWDNIKHEIVAQYDEAEPALKLEAVLISLMKSENEDYGYNQTTIYNDAMKKFASRVEAQDTLFEHPPTENSFFEAFNLPRSACEEMIDQWIFNKEHRSIMKSRLLDGVSFPELSKEYNKSVRYLKTIVYSNCEKLSKRL